MDNEVFILGAVVVLAVLASQSQGATAAVSSPMTAITTSGLKQPGCSCQGG